MANERIYEYANNESTTMIDSFIVFWESTKVFHIVNEIDVIETILELNFYLIYFQKMKYYSNAILLMLWVVCTP